MFRAGVGTRESGRKFLNGAIYIVTQDQRYSGLVRASAESLHRSMPDLPVTVYSQFPMDLPFANIVRILPTHEQKDLSPLDEDIQAANHVSFGTLKTADGFYEKARLMLESPYERTVFLDADIYVAKPFPELFALLDRFDCAANHEEYVNTDWHNRYPCPDIPASFPEFNTGVLVYKRSPAMDSVLQRWCELYRDYRNQNPNLPVNDQPFFREAAYYGDARIATLTREYNCKFRGQGYLNGEVKLLHGHMYFQMDSSYMRRVASIMNKVQGPRVYIANQMLGQITVGRLVSRRAASYVGSFPDPTPLIVQRIRKLKKILSEQGIGKAFKRLLSKMRSCALSLLQ